MDKALDMIRRRIFPTIAALLVFSLFFVWFLINYTSEGYDFRNRVNSELDTVANLFEYRLNAELSSARIFEMVIREGKERSGEIDAERLSLYATYVFRSSEYIDTIVLAPNGVIQHVFPFAENERLVGKNLFDDTEQLPYLERSLESRTAAAQGPFVTNEGSLRIFNRLPVFTTQNGQEEFWGFVSVSLALDRALEAWASQLDLDGFEFFLREVSPNGFEKAFWGRDAMEGKEFAESHLHLPQLTWQLGAYPRVGWKQYIYRHLQYLFVGLIASVFVFLWATNRQARYYDARHRAVTDSLTGCRNRYGFDQMVKNNFVLKKGSALVIMDMDDFKKVNDVLGHHTGDFVLKEIVSLIRTTVRESDDVFRIGGDEFAILLHHLTSPSEVEAVAHRLLNTGSKKMLVNNVKVDVFFTMGIAVASHEGSTLGDLYAKADALLYDAKAKGKSRYSIG